MKEKKVLIDLTYILNMADMNKSTAIYIQRFLDNVNLNNSILNFTFLVRNSVIDCFQKKYAVNNFSYIIFPENKCRISFIRSIMDSLRWKKIVNKIDCEIVYVPFLWIYNIGKVNKLKITTIHDLKPIRETSKKYCKKITLAVFRRLYKKAIKNTDEIICISEYVKNDVIKTFKPSAKISVIYNGVPLKKEEKSIPTLKNKAYILYVNTLTEYKNIQTLIKAFNLIRNNDLYLVVVGKETHYWNSLQSLYMSNKNIIHIGFVSNEELTFLYKHAKIFVTTSLHEGFGFTPIEAALNGCPVISTRCEALPESTMELVNYVINPTSDIELADTINLVLEKQEQEEYHLHLENIKKQFIQRYDVKNFSNTIIRKFLEYKM